MGILHYAGHTREEVAGAIGLAGRNRGYKVIIPELPDEGEFTIVDLRKGKLGHAEYNFYVNAGSVRFEASRRGALSSNTQTRTILNLNGDPELAGIVNDAFAMLDGESIEE